MTPEDVLNLVSDCEQEESGDESRGAQSAAVTQAKPSASGRHTKQASARQPPQKPSGFSAVKTPQNPPPQSSRGRSRSTAGPPSNAPARWPATLREGCLQAHCSPLSSQQSPTDFGDRGIEGHTKPCPQDSILTDPEKGLVAAGDGLNLAGEVGGGVRRSLRVSKKSKQASS